MISNVIVLFNGNLGGDAVVLENKSLRFNVAVSNGNKEKPPTWITVFYQQIAAAEWLKKGAGVFITGELVVEQTSGRIAIYNEQPNLAVQAMHVQITRFVSAPSQPTASVPKDADEDIPF